ncbi:MAG: RidA family protein [Alphaproteobacteria bacterium GM7ARS4]|nr:RidA family protein [Alphaproteobacteria bacterium GM7ARS4]
MTSFIEQKLAQQGFAFPDNGTRKTLYAPWVRHNDTLLISGQLPMDKGKLRYQGQLGDTISIDDAIDAAYLCALNILSHVDTACEHEPSPSMRCVRLTGFIACAAQKTQATPHITPHITHVMDAASTLIRSVFEEPHARSVVGVSSLPLGACVEIEGIFSLP